NDSLLYLTDEVLLNTGGKLYSIDLVAALSVSSQTSANEIQFKLIPNPASDFLSIQSSESNYNWEITDATGRTVSNGFSTETTQIINTSLLTPGIYQIRITTTTNQTATELLIRTK
ncbi:MAG: T9SS type A sorting domain-containing protein, partial [Bacteroidia bacterium]